MNVDDILMKFRDEHRFVRKPAHADFQAAVPAVRAGLEDGVFCEDALHYPSTGAHEPDLIFIVKLTPKGYARLDELKPT